MTSNVFPTLPFLTFNVVRTPMWHTEVQRALSGKRSTLQYMTYPLIHFELSFSLLRDDQTPSDVQSIVGLFNACQGQYDTFLFTDPDFNSVSLQSFGVTDGTTLSYQITATYQNSGGPGYAEAIQNFNQSPSIGIVRYAPLFEYLGFNGREQYCLYSQNYTVSNWTKTNVSVAASSTLCPDGTNQAQLLTDTSSGAGARSIAQSITGATAAGVYTWSIFFWSGSSEATYIWLQVQDQTTSDTITAVFNRATGAVVSSTSTSGTLTSPAPFSAVATTESGALWYRASLAFNKSSTHNVTAVVFLSTSATNVSYTGANGAAAGTLWGAQYENSAVFPIYGPGAGGAVPTLYLPTTTAAITQTDASLGATGVVTLTTGTTLATTAGITLYWYGSFYYRCAFDEDKLDLEKFMTKWWMIKKLPFTSVKL